MVRAYHVIFSAYGFWLPNDPRGSWSDFVGAWELLRFGRATTVTTRRSLARDEHDVADRLAAKRALKHPAVQFDGPQARAVGLGFAEAVRKTGLSIWACSILPEHVHVVFGRHRYSAERVVGLLKAEATRRLAEEGLHPLARFAGPAGRPPSPWGRGCWKVFLDENPGIRRAALYVRENPMKEDKRPQQWSCVRRFAGA